jgi:hypothetical protein
MLLYRLLRCLSGLLAVLARCGSWFVIASRSPVSMWVASTVRPHRWVRCFSWVFFWRLGGKQRCMHHAEAPAPGNVRRRRSRIDAVQSRAHGQVCGDRVARKVVAGAAAKPGVSSICVVSEP